MKLQTMIALAVAFGGTLVVGFCIAMVFLDKTPRVQGIRAPSSDYVDQVRTNPNIIAYDPTLDAQKAEAVQQARELEREKERIRVFENKRRRFLENWKSNLRCDYTGGKWYNSWLNGGGFTNVNIMFYNDSDYTIDEATVKFWVKKRNYERVCHDEMHSFKNVLPHTAQSVSISNNCGMRPPRIGIVQFAVKDLEINEFKEWTEVYKEAFHD